jgi:hypothetical protein
MASNDYDAGYADGRKDAQEKISMLEDEINHLENNFTEWLKEYRAQTERIKELELALKGCIKTIEDYKIDGPSLRAARDALEKKND